MVETQPAVDVDRLLEAIDKMDSVGEIDSTTDALGWISADRMSEAFGVVRQIFRARFSGNIGDDHSLGVRVVSSALGEMQESLSEIGARILDNVPLRGPLPRDVVKATELELSPAVGAGSVVFAMHPPAESGLFDLSVETILDQAIDRLFGVFGVAQAEAEGRSAGIDSSELLQALGPRVALHVFRFAKTLAGEGLNMDFSWASGTGEKTWASLGVDAAKHLERLAKDATTREIEGTLSGTVFRLGDDDRHKFRDDERGIITLESEAWITDVLAESFRKSRVRIECVIRESVSVATGRASQRFTATSAELVLDGVSE